VGSRVGLNGLGRQENLVFLPKIKNHRPKNKKSRIPKIKNQNPKKSKTRIPKIKNQNPKNQKP